MRKILFFGLLAANAVYAADYSEDRQLSLDAAGLDVLEVRAGAGSMQIRGEDGLDEVLVEATIVVPDSRTDKAQEAIAEKLVLYLEKEGDNAVLLAQFEQSFFNFGDSPRVHLEIRVPARFGLDIDDGSGSIEIDDVRGDLKLNDGSGSLTLTNVGGDLEIEDGSGSITITGVGGNIRIDDGSGGIKVREVAGSVTVDDGSGSIDVAGIESDLIIENDGSGGLNFSDIGGRVENNS